MVENAGTIGVMSGLTEPLRNIGTKLAGWFAPACEATVVDGSCEIVVELPGVSVEDIDVAVHDDSPALLCNGRSEQQEGSKICFFPERSCGEFQRAVRLPPDAGPQVIEAVCMGDVLMVKVAKRSSESSGRKFEIKQP